MRTIVIGFSRPKKFQPLAKLIMLFEGTNWSHAYTKFNAITLQRNLIYQASGREVNFEGSVHFQNHAIPVHEYEIDVEDSVYLSIMQFCVDNAGMPYGLLAACGAGLVKLAKIFGKKINNPFNDGLTSEYCSELTARIVDQALKDKLTEYDLDNLTPKDLKEIMDKLPGARKTL